MQHQEEHLSAAKGGQLCVRPGWHAAKGQACHAVRCAQCRASGSALATTPGAPPAGEAGAIHGAIENLPDAAQPELHQYFKAQGYSEAARQALRLVNPALSRALEYGFTIKSERLLRAARAKPHAAPPTWCDPGATAGRHGW